MKKQYLITITFYETKAKKEIKLTFYHEGSENHINFVFKNIIKEYLGYDTVVNLEGYVEEIVATKPTKMKF